MTMIANVKALVGALRDSLSAAATLTSESGFFEAARLRAHLCDVAPAATALEPTSAVAPGGVHAKPEGDPGRRAPRARSPRSVRREAW